MSFTGKCTETALTLGLDLGPSLVTTQTGPVQQAPALAAWKSNVRSKNPKQKY